MEEEIWREVNGYPYYQVSSLGRVKSLRFNKERYLTACLSNHGYMAVSLYKESKKTTYLVHRLVAKAFLNLENDGHKIVVNHKDFNRINNNVNNLEVVTARENNNLKHIPHSSKYTGVSWHKSNNRWISMITINKKLKHLGYYKIEHDAHLAYEKALRELCDINFDLL